MKAARCLAFALILLAMPARAEAPKAYTVVETQSLVLENQTVKVYRNGNRAMVEQSAPRQSGGGLPAHTRTFYDFTKGNSWTQVIGDPTAIPCTKSAANAADWGDPFTQSASLLERLAKEKTTEIGPQIVGSVSAKLVAATAPDGSATARLWVEPKTNLIVKFELAPKDEPARVMIEVKDFKIGPPPASVFDLPSVCRRAP